MSAPPDPWRGLAALTTARIALGRAGPSLPTRELLALGLAHARARDAVHAALDSRPIADRLAALGLKSAAVESAAGDRRTYLRRPDLGRRLSTASAATLPAGSGPDIVLVVADGLSAAAAQAHALPLIEAFLRHGQAAGWRIGPVVIATQARVALGDEIGEILGARAVAMLIGERPGLSTPDSLGVYLTFAPRNGRTDAERNCISNIHAHGLSPEGAAARLAWLLQAAFRLGLTGVDLKDESDLALIGEADPAARLEVPSGPP